MHEKIDDDHFDDQVCGICLEFLGNCTCGKEYYDMFYRQLAPCPTDELLMALKQGNLIQRKVASALLTKRMYQLLDNKEFFPTSIKIEEIDAQLSSHETNENLEQS